jgi:hypothetical protein
MPTLLCDYARTVCCAVDGTLWRRHYPGATTNRSGPEKSKRGIETQSQNRPIPSRDPDSTESKPTVRGPKVKLQTRGTSCRCLTHTYAVLSYCSTPVTPLHKSSKIRIIPHGDWRRVAFGSAVRAVADVTLWLCGCVGVQS